MKAYTYKNTKTNIPGWETTTHLNQKFGYGYETDTHFVHFYGKEAYFIISVGLTVIEPKTGTYAEWIEKRFGATDVQEMEMEVGHTVEAVWRPSLFYWDDTQKGLKIDSNEQRKQEQALRILVEKLDEILLFIEPSCDGLKAYSHKIRELLILSCTEIENQWRSLLVKANHAPLNGREFKTNDYVKLLQSTFLDEYEIALRNYDSFLPSKPFKNWDASCPTQSLPWYDAYNKTKHDRDAHFSSAQFQYAIDAVAANIIMYCARFSPLILINDTNTLSGLIKQIFDIRMVDCNRKSFYIPKLTIPANMATGCIVCDSYLLKYNEPWTIERFNLS